MCVCERECVCVREKDRGPSRIVTMKSALPRWHSAGRSIKISVYPRQGPSLRIKQSLGVGQSDADLGTDQGVAASVFAQSRMPSA